MLSDYFLNEVYPYFNAKLQSEGARRTYKLALESISDFCKKDFLDITEVDARAYSNALSSGKILSERNRAFSKTSISVRLSALRSVAAFLEESNDIFDYGKTYKSAFASLPVSDTPDIAPDKIPSVEDIDRIMQAAPSLEFRVIFLMAWRCGLTVSEIITLKRSYLFSDASGQLGIRFSSPKKGERFVKIPQDIQPDVTRYLASLMPGDDHVFLNNKRRPFSEAYLYRVVRNIVASSGASALWSLKDLRNACAAHALYSGAQPSATASFLGVLPRWLKRYDRVVSELDLQPCDLSFVQVKGGGKS